MSYNISYKTYESLLADVMGDFKQYSANKMVDPGQLIRLAKAINYKLGQKLNDEKQEIIEIEKGRARLPLNFQKLLTAYVCNAYSQTSPVLQGDQREYKVVVSANPAEKICKVECDPEPACKPYQNPCIQINDCGDHIEIVQTLKTQTRHFKQILPIKIERSTEVSPNCPNLYYRDCDLTGHVKKGFIYTSFEEGIVYLKYLGTMEDEKGNLLVPDHDMLTPYYEYTLKRRILENLRINGENITADAIQLVERGYLESKREAEGIINMPDNAEFKDIQEKNRKKMYNKYFHPFN